MGCHADGVTNFYEGNFQQALALLERVRSRGSGPRSVATKSGLMLGLGERNDEVRQALRDLRAHGVDDETLDCLKSILLEDTTDGREA